MGDKIETTGRSPLGLIAPNGAYSKEIQEAFQLGKALTVFKRYIYGFRDNARNPDFHFLIGMCMLYTGHYNEARTAFTRALKDGAGDNARVFLSYTCYRAQHDEEARGAALAIDAGKLSPATALALMAIKSSYGMPVNVELSRVIDGDYPSDADRYTAEVIAYKYAKMEEDALFAIEKLEPSIFNSMSSFSFVVKDMYRLGFKDKAGVLLNKVVPDVLTPEDLLKYIKTSYAISAFFDEDEVAHIFGIIQRQKEETGDNGRRKYKELWKECKIRLLSQMVEWKKREGKDVSDEIARIRQYKTDFEQKYLCLAEYALSHYDEADKAELKDDIERLIKIDQENLYYRKLYYEFLCNHGFLKQADEVAKATLQLKKRKEKEEHELIHKFWSFYEDRPCLLTGYPVHKEHDGKFCPLCFGSGKRPIVKMISFGHSMNPIYTDNMESHVILPNESLLRDMVTWQPMDVESPLVSRYLHSLGAYMADDKVVDVLTAGETYIFITLKEEAKERLKKEGYSLWQVDPVEAYSFAKNSNVSGWSKDGREYANDALSANDFIVEVIHAISGSEELEKES